MPTNAILFGNGGSSQSAGSKALNFPSPFSTDQVSATVTDNNFWTQVVANPVAINTATVKCTTYKSSSPYGLTFDFNNSIIINKIFSVILWRDLYPTKLYSKTLLGLWMFANDDSYIPNDATGFGVLSLPYSSGTHNLSITVDSTTKLHYQETNRAYRVALTNGSDALITKPNSWYMTIRYI